MEKTLIGPRQGPHWLDVINPEKADLEAIGREYGLHPTSIQDCLDPEHLAKFEKIDQTNFVILRAFDEACGVESDSLQELTRKVAIFYSENFILTIHRIDQPYLCKIRERWQSKGAGLSRDNIGQILLEIFQSVLTSYDRPIDAALNQLETLEMGLFEAHGSKPFNLVEGYYLKRRSFVIRRMVRSLLDVIPKVAFGPGVNAPAVQSLREDTESSFYYMDEVLESINGLLSLHISLASQKTNESSYQTTEVMRVLTIFSMFLLPLNLITGIYGMNFDIIPELHWEHGYAFALCLMVTTVVCIYMWFRRKGWLRRDELKPWLRGPKRTQPF